MIGEVLSNRYEIVAKIGDGGMSLVYSAKDTLLNRLVAVKVLREQYANDREFLERFHREAQAAASLSHPNVVNVYDVGTVNETPFIVMEYVEGKNLSEIIREQERLSPDYAVKIVLQICSALAHAHKYKIVHRDIKPHNILITGDNQVKVTDFGIAAVSSMSITQTGVVLGSVLYFSPEQARGTKVDHLSDLYSLGIVMYEMLTGRVPFRADTPISTALKHIQDLPKPPSQLNPDIPADLERIILKLLAKKPEERFQSAQELSRALEKLEFNAGIEKTQKFVIDPDQIAPDEREEEDDLARASRKMSSRKKKSKQKNRLPLVLLSLLVLSVMVYGIIEFIPRVLFPDDVQVPDVTGFSVEEAERLLNQRNLKMAVEIEVFDNEFPKGTVISQDPRANRMKKENQFVYVRVSKGPEFVDMPSVIGMSNREAQVFLTQFGFTLGEISYQPTDEHPVNTVIGQIPEPGEHTALGTPIDLIISQSIDEAPLIMLPDFRGQNINDVRQQLAELGLKEGLLIQEYSTTVPKDLVIEQNPPPRTEVEVGWTVDLVYSQGLPTSGRPDSEGILHWTTGDDWHEEVINIYVPEGRDQEVAIIIVDDFGAREVYREIHKGDTSFTYTARGRGNNARVQVYIGGRLFIDRDLVE